MKIPEIFINKFTQLIQYLKFFENIFKAKQTRL